MPEPQMIFDFMDLPRELRDEIYSYLLIEHDPSVFHPIPTRTPTINTRPQSCQADSDEQDDREGIGESDESASDSDTSTVTNSQVTSRLFPAILATNKEIHFESVGLLYGSNRFDISSSFLDSIGAKNAHLIRHVRIPFPTFSRLDAGSVALNDESAESFDMLNHMATELHSITLNRRQERPMSRTSHSLNRRMDGTWIPFYPADVVAEAYGLIVQHIQVSNTSAADFELMVQLYDREVTGDMLGEVEGRGWVLEKFETPEEPPMVWHRSQVQDRVTVRSEFAGWIGSREGGDAAGRDGDGNEEGEGGSFTTTGFA